MLPTLLLYWFGGAAAAAAARTNRRILATVSTGRYVATASVQVASGAVDPSQTTVEDS